MSAGSAPPPPAAAIAHRRADGVLMERAPLVKVTMRGIERDAEDGHGRDAAPAAGFYRSAGRRAPRAAGRRDCCSTGVPPCSILWTPIHPITWFAPFVGHMGITDSSGRLHDWGGGPIRAASPSEMMFGAPCRYLCLAAIRTWNLTICRSPIPCSHRALSGLSRPRTPPRGTLRSRRPTRTTSSTCTAWCAATTATRTWRTHSICRRAPAPTLGP